MVTDNFCEGGFVPPLWKWKANEVGVGLSVEVLVEELTTSVTSTVCGLPVAPVEVMVTEPVYVAAVRPPGLTETFTDPGVVPDDGVAESHVAVVATV